jgi:hypothetical protein
MKQLLIYGDLDMVLTLLGKAKYSHYSVYLIHGDIATVIIPEDAEVI